ncbi:MAG TPA: fused response regulator/phosphatase [Jatrophihabitantaceae bacterium]|nr:fused response regulator/phosphatase [Jatrophihabitantaceae bacterium]
MLPDRLLVGEVSAARPPHVLEQVSGLRLLVIEDDAGDRAYLSECLAELGAQPGSITWATLLADGLRAIAERPDCVLVDLGLADASGMQAVETLVSAAPGAAVVVLTEGNDLRVVRALAAGAEDYLVKADLGAELLGRCVRYAVERKRAEATVRQLHEAQLRAAENRRLERGLLPRLLITDHRIEFASHYRPGQGHILLGGDFLDAVEGDDGSVRIVIGDVMGHGTDQAALGVHLRAAWRALVLARTAPSTSLGNLHRMLAAEAPAEWLVTVCDLTIAADRRSLTVRSAGHPAPLLADGGRVRYLPIAVEPPLGTGAPGSGTAGYRRSVHVALGASWRLLLFTDGLLDSFRDPSDEADIGLDGLLRAARSAGDAAADPAGWISGVMARAARGVTDDLAVLALAYTAEDVPRRYALHADAYVADP